MKWHPGHYVRSYQRTPIGFYIQKIAGRPHFEGVQVTYGWPDLEKAKDVYDFSAVERDLKELQSHNKRMILHVADKIFNPKLAPCVPEYLRNDPLYAGGQHVVYDKAGRFRTCIAKRWQPAVQDRLIALYTALGKRFDQEPYFEALSLEENTVPKKQDLSDFSASVYSEQVKRGMTALAKAFPNTTVLQWLNWGPDIGEWFEHAHKSGIGVGGPDLLPTHHTTAYPYYRQYSGRMPLSISAQTSVVLGYIRKGDVTVDRMFDFAVTDPNGLKVNYVIWNVVETPGWSFEKQIVPLVEKRKGLINDGLPSNRTMPAARP